MLRFKAQALIHDPLLLAIAWGLGFGFTIGDQHSVIGPVIFLASVLVVIAKVFRIVWRSNGKHRPRPSQDRSGTAGGADQGPYPGARPEGPSAFTKGTYSGVATDFGGFSLAIGEIYGARSWSVHNGRLWPLHHKEFGCWQSGLNYARCERVHGGLHRYFGEEGVPAEICSCGYYAYSHEGPSIYHVTGVIAGSGRTLVGTQGFRCEKARIVGVIDPRARAFFSGRKLHHEIRKNYPDVKFYPSLKALLKAHPLTPPPEEYE